MKKGLWITALLIALVVAVLLSGVTSAGGVRFDFHIEPGCVVEITPLHYWYKDANGAVHKARDGFTFNLGRASWEVEEPFRTHLEEFRVISVETVRAGVLQEVVYSVVLKKKAKPRLLLEAVRMRNDNHKVTLILGQQEIDV